MSRPFWVLKEMGIIQRLFETFSKIAKVDLYDNSGYYKIRNFLRKTGVQVANTLIRIFQCIHHIWYYRFFGIHSFQYVHYIVELCMLISILFSRESLKVASNGEMVSKDIFPLEITFLLLNLKASNANHFPNGYKVLPRSFF